MAPITDDSRFRGVIHIIGSGDRESLSFATRHNESAAKMGNFQDRPNSVVTTALSHSWAERMLLARLAGDEPWPAREREGPGRGA